MTTEAEWLAMANEQASAASVLNDRGLKRPAVSRCYYAVYSLVTASLVRQGMRTFGRWKNPEHASLPSLITHNLPSLGMKSRRDLSTLTRRLRAAREDADYRPKATIDEASQRNCIRDMHAAARVLEHRWDGKRTR